MTYLAAIHLKTGGFSPAKHPILSIQVAIQKGVFEPGEPKGVVTLYGNVSFQPPLEVDPVAGKMVGFTDPESWNAQYPTIQTLTERLHAILPPEAPKVLYLAGGRFIKSFLDAQAPGLIPGTWKDYETLDVNEHAKVLKAQGLIPDAKVASAVRYFDRELDEAKGVTAADVLRLGLDFDHHLAGTN